MKWIVLAVLPLILSLPSVAGDGPAGLSPTDRLKVREAQLALAQSHIALLQEQVKVKEAETSISALIQSLKTQYACPTCELQSDLTWKCPPPAPTPQADTQLKTPAPPKASGQTSKKE